MIAADQGDDEARRLIAEARRRQQREDAAVESLALDENEAQILAAVNNVFRRRRMQRARELATERALMSAMQAERDRDLERFGRLGATPETLRKLRADATVRMFSRGQIGQPEMEAVTRIREARSAVAQALYPVRVMEPIATKNRGTWSGNAGLERLSGRQIRLWRAYCRWAATMTDKPFKGVDASRLDIILAVIDHNFGVRQVEQVLGVKHGTVREIVVAGLVDYAVQNGLASQHEPMNRSDK